MGAVPEGLPAILSITLARGVQRMAGRNAITRKLNSIETLGSVSVICSDKTGTLTKNEMTVRCVATPGQRYEVEGQGYAPEGSITDDDGEVDLDDHADLRAVVETMAVANEAELTEDDGEWTLVGEPTDGALITLAKKASFVTSGYERSDEIPFNSDNKFMAVVAGNGDGTKCVHLKGAPGRVLELCSTQGTLEDNEELDRDMWEELIDELSDEGLRVLAAAVREGDSLDGDDPGGGFTLVGMVGIVDPPRPEAIEDCRRAGIRVKMITGDHIGTAEAIGRELGLGDGEELRSITGSELENASDEELEEIAQTHDVFARTSPEHKLRLVKALQERGEVVAMTGDGVNDAPALRRADVGVAMGIKGTEVTKEAAEVVLADDNFTSIEQAVEEGRTIYDNLRKSILFILPTNGAESRVPHHVRRGQPRVGPHHDGQRPGVGPGVLPVQRARPQRPGAAPVGAVQQLGRVGVGGGAGPAAAAVQLRAVHERRVRLRPPGVGALGDLDRGRRRGAPHRRSREARHAQGSQLSETC